jgi:hypothetical protein
VAHQPLAHVGVCGDLWGESQHSRSFDHLAANHSENMFFCFRWLLILFKREFRYSVSQAPQSGTLSDRGTAVPAGRHLAISNS